MVHVWNAQSHAVTGFDDVMQHIFQLLKGIDGESFRNSTSCWYNKLNFV